MEIDLPPKDWIPDRAKTREPVFGPGLPAALAYGIGWLFTFSALYYFAH
jgi:hypothetical protein